MANIPESTIKEIKVITQEQFSSVKYNLMIDVFVTAFNDLDNKWIRLEGSLAALQAKLEALEEVQRKHNIRIRSVEGSIFFLKERTGDSEEDILALQKKTTSFNEQGKIVNQIGLFFDEIGNYADPKQVVPKEYIDLGTQANKALIDINKADLVIVNEILVDHEERLDLISQGFTYKGTVPTFEDLPVGATNGDLYTVLDENKMYAYVLATTSWELFIDLNAIPDATISNKGLMTIPHVVDVEKIPGMITSISDNRTDIDTNITSISDNRTDIDTNRTDIDTNRTDIDTNRTDIDTNRTDIDTNINDVDTLDNKTSNLNISGNIDNALALSYETDAAAIDATNKIPHKKYVDDNDEALQDQLDNIMVANPRGTVDDIVDLPPTGNSYGDSFIVEGVVVPDDAGTYVWNKDDVWMLFGNVGDIPLANETTDGLMSKEAFKDVVDNKAAIIVNANNINSNLSTIGNNTGKILSNESDIVSLKDKTTIFNTDGKIETNRFLEYQNPNAIMFLPEQVTNKYYVDKEDTSLNNKIIANENAIAINLIKINNNTNNILGNTNEINALEARVAILEEALLPSNAISTPQELQDYDGSYDAIIINNIDMSSFGDFIPITELTHNLDGQGFTISNLAINGTNITDIGLFKSISGTGNVHDLYLEDSNVTSTTNYVGSLAGTNYGIIENVGIILGTANGNDYIGGLVGRNYGDIIDSYTTGNITGKGRIGGLVGSNNDSSSSVINSYATGDVTGDTGFYVGGLVGDNIGDIIDSYATGDVIGSAPYVGGLVGQNYSIITNSFAYGNVIGTGGNVGGLVGQNSGNLTNSYRWDGQTVTGGDNTKGDPIDTDDLFLASWQETTLLFNIDDWDMIDDQLPLIKDMANQIPILKP